MAASRRILKINSLLKEVITEVIQKDLQHAGLPDFVTITQVDTSADLQFAKVYVSILSQNQDTAQDTIKILNHNAKHITYKSTRKVSLRYFPELTFKHDMGLIHQQEIDALFENLNSDPQTPQTP